MTQPTDPAIPAPGAPGALWPLTERFIEAYAGVVETIEPHLPQDLFAADVLHLAHDANVGATATPATLEINPSPIGIWCGAIDSQQLFLARIGTEDEVLEALLNCLQPKSKTGS